jgi:hypothetical protein
MTAAGRSATEEIAVQEGAPIGKPVMIPGAFEPRADRPTASATAAPRVTPRVPRSAAPRRTILERIWRYVMRPTDTPPI